MNKILDDDIKRLRKHIIPIHFKPCTTISEEFHNDVLPVSFKADLDAICSLYGALLIANKDNNSRFCHIPQMNTIYAEVPDFIRLEDICIRISHELGHQIQHLIGSLYTNWKTFEERLAYERQASRFSYFIYKEYFSHLRTLKHHKFMYYRSKHDIDFLKKKHFKFHDK